MQDKLKSTVEFMQYLPFGEAMAHQKIAGWGSPYTFTGKEQDAATGLHYFGARYLDTRLSMWFGVDPLAEAPANIGYSPYHYTWNNPIKFIDPDGRHGESTHLDEKGNILAEHDNGDNGVYVHKSGTNIECEYSVEITSAGGKYIGELGGVIDINEIYSNLLSENMETADGMWNPFKFKNLVKNGGDWDYKSRKNTIYGLGNDGITMFSFEGNFMESQDIGNHHFGAVAKEFRFPELFSLREAGAAQMAAGTSRPEWQKYETIEMPGIKTGQTFSKRVMIAPYGDDPRDQKWIKSGYKYARR